MRCLKVVFSDELIDAAEIENINATNDYTASRLFGAKMKKAGIQFRSVGNAGAICWGLISRLHVESAIQTQHFEFVFDGEGISKVRELSIK